MPTVIDALIVTLGLDPSKFDAGQKKAVESLRKFDEKQQKSNKEAQIGAKQMTEAFGKVAGSIAAIGAAVIGARDFTSWLTKTVEGTAQLGRTSKMLGMSAKDIEAYGAATKAFGGTAEGFENTMQNIEGGLAAWRMGTGGENIVTALARLGVQSKDGRVNLDELANALKRVKDTMGIQTAWSLAQQLGMDQGTFQMMTQGAQAMDTLVDSMREQSRMSEDATRKAQELQKTWAHLEQTASGLAQTLFGSLAPSLEKGLAAMDRFLGDTNKKGLWGAMGLPEKSEIQGSHDKSKSVMQEWWENLLEQIKNEKSTPMGGVNSKRMSQGGRSAVASPLFERLEKQYGLPAGLLDKIWAQESGRGVNMRSKKGAMGHFQFMHDTAQELGLSDADTMDLDKSATAAAKYLRQLLAHYHGSLGNALGAYNWGMGNLDRFGMGKAPAETQAYVAKLLGGQGTGSGGTHVETNIGAITIQTQATDANGIARDIHGAIQNNALVSAGLAGAH